MVFFSLRRVQFWKFAITCANHAQEVKIWACESWSCLQTLRILPNMTQSPPFRDARPPFVTVRLDQTANYLLLSDINRKVVQS